MHRNSDASWLYMKLDWTLRNKIQGWERAVKDLTWCITAPGRRPQLLSSWGASGVPQKFWGPFPRKQTHENILSACEVRQAGKVAEILTPEDLTEIVCLPDTVRPHRDL